MDEIRLHGEDGNRCGTVTASSGTSAGTGSVNLSSPESAYSTGYSTDGTSPGTSYPPEYYINIRTGTHYFQSNANANAGTATGNYSNNNNNNSSSKNNNNNNNGRPKKPSDSSDLPVACASLLSGRSRHGRFEGNVEPSVSGCVTMFSTATMTMDKSGKDVVRSNEYGRTSKVRAYPDRDLLSLITQIQRRETDSRLHPFRYRLDIRCKVTRFALTNRSAIVFRKRNCRYSDQRYRRRGGPRNPSQRNLPGAI